MHTCATARGREQTRSRDPNWTLHEAVLRQQVINSAFVLIVEIFPCASHGHMSQIIYHSQILFMPRGKLSITSDSSALMGKEGTRRAERVLPFLAHKLEQPRGRSITTDF